MSKDKKMLAEMYKWASLEAPKKRKSKGQKKAEATDARR